MVVAAAVMYFACTKSGASAIAPHDFVGGCDGLSLTKEGNKVAVAAIAGRISSLYFF
jgi:hypothetical protein